jgi:UDP-N-acetylmuramate dehydrogenase
VFGERLLCDTAISRYTAARIGGLADYLLVVESVDQLADTALKLYDLSLPFLVLGGGSNILVADSGIREVVVVNRAKEVRFSQPPAFPAVWAASGANFGAIARQAAARGFSGLEWATGIPGTVGGAVFGNAGAHGGDVAASISMAEILHPNGSRREWASEELAFQYRSSILKRDRLDAVVLSARFFLEHSSPKVVKRTVDVFTKQRQLTQPPGASMGSMFKNPPGDYAGRLIEAAGLKGTRVGDAQISELHANFFINLGEATATDVYSLIRVARQTVSEKFGLTLELEIELIGGWDD